MDVYRNLYTSVRERLMWEDHPIEVNRALHLLDGAHRLAMALAFQQRQVTLLQTCWASGTAHDVCTSRQHRPASGCS